jgi:hypothetical protein
MRDDHTCAVLDMHQKVVEALDKRGAIAADSVKKGVQAEGSLGHVAPG